MTIQYVARTDDLRLKVQPDGAEIFSLPYGLKVDFIETKDQRDRFKILEGINKGKLASVSAGPGQSYLTASMARKPPVSLTFDRKAQRLTFPGHAPVNAFSGGGHQGFTPVAAGTYELAIPAFPTKQTRAAYSNWTKYHKLWFRIGTDLSGSRFLHPGVISDGCVTVRQFIYDPESGTPPPAGFHDLVDGARSVPGLIGLPLPAVRVGTVSWDEVVDALILARLNDQAVGRLIVT